MAIIDNLDLSKLERLLGRAHTDIRSGKCVKEKFVREMTDFICAVDNGNATELKTFVRKGRKLMLQPS